jgi:hypothetical protein
MTSGPRVPPPAVVGPGPTYLINQALRPRSLDLRLRGLAELLVQAHATSDHALVDAVDAAVGALTADGSGRFVNRLRELRGLFGPLPVDYPIGREDAPPAGRRPNARVRAAVAAVVRWADATLGLSQTVSGPRRAELTCKADLAAALIDQYQTVRPGARPHRGACRALAVPRSLTWRTWWWHDGRPILGVPAWTLPRARLALMFGIHAGAHLDHQLLLAAERGATAAARLQFGDGLVIAESVAMTVEYAAGAMVAELRPVVRQGLIERLARLPRLAAWGPDLVPDSDIMARAVATADREFSSFPRLAAAYTAGPVLLAQRDFAHPLVPRTLRPA